MPRENLNPFVIAKSQFERAARRLDLDEGMQEDPVDAQARAHRVHSGAHGHRPLRGVHRLSRPAQHRARSGEGRHPLPPGRDARRGSGAGVMDDVEVRVPRTPVRRRQGRRDRAIPRLLSQGELERLTRRYACEILPIIGPEQDIPAPDVYTNAQTMAWMMDTFSMTKGATALGVVTGKPVALGGSLGRDRATARGVQFTLREACRIAASSSPAPRSRSRASAMRAVTSRRCWRRTERVSSRPRTRAAAFTIRRA